MKNVVSIVMPVYNGEKYIKDAIDSVIAQSYLLWELIIINDGSTDKTADIISSFNDSRIRYYHQENKGQTVALNHGLDLIQGNYYTTLDADDCYPVDSLLCRVAFLDNHPEYDAVYADGYFCDENLNPITRFSDLRIQNSIGDVYGDFAAESLCTGGGTVMIRSAAIRKNRIRYDELIVWCQDMDFLIRVAEKCQFGMVDNIAHLYRVHDNNMTLSMPSGLRLESLIRAKFKVLCSPKLATVPLAKKYEYFRKLFIENLHNRLEDQEQVLKNPNFLELPKYQQGRLLRHAASMYLFEGKNTAVAKIFLKKSLMEDPLDWKTIVLTTLVSIHPDLAKWVVIKRKMISPTKVVLPFDKS